MNKPIRADVASKESFNEWCERIESKGHRLRRLEDGTIDDFAFDVDPQFAGRGHNGVRCELCNDVFCVHCTDDEQACDIEAPCGGDS